jgi:8-oxo-dGTP diphosphatase
MSGTTNRPTAHVLIRRGNELLFVMRSNTVWQRGKYSLPAGRVETGESFREAAVREVLEEVGLRVLPEQLRQVYTLHRNEAECGTIWVEVFFEAELWEGEPHNGEPSLHSGIEWLPAGALPLDKIIPNHAAALQNLALGETYSEMGWEGENAE